MAMKFAEKFLNMMTLNDVDDYDEYDEDYEAYDDDYEDSYDDGYGVNDDYDDGNGMSKVGKAFADMKKPSLSFRNKANDINERRENVGETRVIPFSSRQGDLEVVKVVKPQEFNEAQTIVEHLKAGRTVVVNLEGIEISQAQRIIDFVGGASFIIDGSLKAISNNIFIVAPSNIEVSGDLKTEILNEAMLSPEIGQI